MAEPAALLAHSEQKHWLAGEPQQGLLALAGAVQTELSLPALAAEQQEQLAAQPGAEAPLWPA